MWHAKHTSRSRRMLATRSNGCEPHGAASVGTKLPCSCSGAHVSILPRFPECRGTNSMRPKLYDAWNALEFSGATVLPHPAGSSLSATCSAENARACQRSQCQWLPLMRCALSRFDQRTTLSYCADVVPDCKLALACCSSGGPACLLTVVQNSERRLRTGASRLLTL